MLQRERRVVGDEEALRVERERVWMSVEACAGRAELRDNAARRPVDVRAVRDEIFRARRGERGPRFRRHVDPDSNVEIIRRWFYLVNVTNTGAAFGSFKNNNAFFIILSLVAMVAVLFVLFRKQGHPDTWRDLSLALLLAGIMGNLTDRIVHGHVTDFLLFNLHIRFANPWPAFNIADACICIAVICFIVHSLREKPATNRAEAKGL